MRKAAVIFGTDGNSDYVQTPDGRKYSLGPVSVLTLVSGLVQSPRAIRAAMNEFLAKRQVQLQVDLEAMWKLLPVRRARYSSVGDSMDMDKWKMGPSEPQIKTAADGNADLVESILRRVAEAGAESMALEGKGFPVTAVEARVELVRIASAVGELAEGDLADPQTRLDLYRLNSDVNRVLAKVKGT
jgi:hypothetical protein